MESNGIQVAINESLTEVFISKLNRIEPDLVLFDIESIEDEHLVYLEQLLEQSKIPIIINDVSALAMNESKASSKWNKKLLEKIAGITGKTYWQEDLSHSQIEKNTTLITGNSKASLAKNIWVLGASLGGPDALKNFLSEIPKNLPVTFIVAQHLGENFVSILAEQLNRHTPFSVMLPKEGHVARHQEVLLVPTDQRLIINSIGAVEFRKLEEETQYMPSINMVISDMAVRYKNKIGVIIFSGLCDDGVDACEEVSEHGGQVWIQDPKSCVISAMPENVNKRIDVNFCGTPKQLAKHLVSYYQ